MSAKDIALRASEQALAAAANKRQQRENEEAEYERQKLARCEAAFHAALPLLNEWFPGAEWVWQQMGDYGHDTIVWEADEQWPPSFKLHVENFSEKVIIKVGDYVQDTSMPGYSYFSGGVIKSAADLGEYLEGR